MNFWFGLKRHKYLQTLLKDTPNATADIRGGPGYSKLRGLTSFFELPEGVLVYTEVSGLPVSGAACSNSVFGYHIHEGTSCSGTAQDPFADTKLHYNPHNCPHPEHAGDLPPLFANVNGFAWQAVLTDRFKVNDIIGRTVVIHAKADDFHSQPSGDSGAKIACGVIKRKNY